MFTELLAPAKDKQTAIEAINCGADAVYIGAPRFGARKNVPNTLDDIKEVVDYAHKFWVKVFVTMNTILTDSELNEAVDLAKKLSSMGVDAIIIQDMGLLDELITLIPSLDGDGAQRMDGATQKLAPIHMSTQCDNYLPQKVKFFNEIGVSRVILARELSLDQIKEIHKQNPNLELEAFVHGALCVSMSGQCYLSQEIGRRSANRGECAQPCRKKYTVKTDTGETIKKDFYALSLKDFNASKHIEELKKSGVCSFKIEGRLKDIGYVKNTVAYYRNKIGKGTSSGKSIYNFIPNPEKTFNRGFTDYFLKERTLCFNQESPKSRGEYIGKVIEIKKDCFKLDTNKKINKQDGIYFKENGFIVNKVENNYIFPNKNIQLKIGDNLWRNFDSKFEKELLKPVKRQIGVTVLLNSFQHPTNKKFNPKICEIQKQVWDDNKNKEVKITLIDEDGISISGTLPQDEKANNPEKMKEKFIKQFSKTGDTDFYIEKLNIETELPFMPVSQINKLRRDLFDVLMQKRLEEYNKNQTKQRPMRYVKYFQNEVDYRANIHNKSAEEFYKKCGVKVLEPSFEKEKPKRQVELMRCKHCIKYSLNMCKSSKNLILVDEFGKKYPLKFNCKTCEMSVLSSK